MGTFAWDESLRVGVPDIDEEHRQWIAVFNRLADAVQRHKAREVIEDTVNELLRYSKFHFNHEERLLREFEYPDLEEQIRQHEYFMTWLLEAKKELNESIDEDLAIDLLELMEGWLTTHIQNVDKKYEQYFCRLPQA